MIKQLLILFLLCLSQIVYSQNILNKRVSLSRQSGTVGELLDEVLGAVVGAAAPLAVVIGEVHVDQILGAVGDVDGAILALPVDAAHHGGLGRIVILFPVVAAAVEVVEDGG